MSLLPTPAEFNKQHDDDAVLTDTLPDRPIASLRDLQYLYGHLYTLATAGVGDRAPYLTPGKSADLFDEPESLAILQVDLTDAEPKLDAKQPTVFRSYRREDVTPVAHSWYDSGRGFDHSITHRTGAKKDPDDVAGYLHGRLTDWASDDIIQKTADSHEDGWIINALAQLGEQDGIEEAIAESVKRQLEGPTTALTTVSIKTDPDGGYNLPGACETDVFNEAMQAHKRSKLISKNEATNSTGDGTDLVTGRDGPTVGTAEDPLNYFLSKQLGKFPGFDADEAWRSHPVSEDVAVTLMNASAFVDACSYYTLKSKVYYLPYFFGQLTADDVRSLYGILYAVTNSDDLTPVEWVYRQATAENSPLPNADRLQFYVGTVLQKKPKRYDVFGDDLNASLVHPVELARKHAEVLSSWAFTEEGVGSSTDVRPALPVFDNWPLLRPDVGTIISTITNGSYVETTFGSQHDRDTVSADDFHVKALTASLTGGSIPVDTLLEEYVERLIDESDNGFPSVYVSIQHAQLSAFRAVGLLTGTDESLTEEPTYGTSQMTDEPPTAARTDGGQKAVKRAEKLEQFLSDTPALSPASPQRRSGFLLGVLVGQVSSYQQSAENRSTTLVDQYPIKSITGSKITRIVGETLDKNIIYTRENHMSSTMYAEVVDALVAALSQTNTEGGWSINTSELRYYYALGVAYGMNNWVSNDDSDEAQPISDQETITSYE